MKKIRLLSMSLALCMLLTLLPARALAGEDSASVSPVEEAGGWEQDPVRPPAEPDREGAAPSDPAAALLAESLANGTCGSDLQWNLDSDGTLTISGTGSMMDSWQYNGSPWYDSRLEIKTVRIQAPVANIGSYAFFNCTALTSVILPDSLSEIGSMAFLNCSSLTDIPLPESLTIIYSSAFSGCSSLERIAIPAGVISVGIAAFLDCAELLEIQADPDNPYYTSRDGVLFNKDMNTLLVCPGGKTGDYMVPDGVTGIAEYAFEGCGKLTALSLPDSVRNIGSCAFEYCKGLTDFAIPDGVSEIASFSFMGCTSLRGVSVPSSVTRIAGRAFSQCGSLTSFVIPDGVGCIEDSTFLGCSSLAGITIPGSVTSVIHSAFSGCGKLADVYFGGTEAQWQSLLIGQGNSDLTGAEIHYGGPPTSGDCGSQLTWTLDASGTLTISGFGDMWDWDASGASPWCGAHRLAVTSVSIDAGVTSIGDYAFSGCANLEYVWIPETVQDIGSRAFSDCGSLAGISIPRSVSSIGSYAYQGCSFYTLSIPDSVASIGSGAFRQCANLREANIPGGARLGTSIFSHCGSLSNVAIEEGVTSIPDNTFYQCGGLEAVRIPASAERVSGSAFAFCSALRSVEIDSGNAAYTSIDGVVYNREKTKLVLMPGGKSGVYTGIPSTVSEVSIFYSPSLEGVILPDSVTKLFSGSCEKLKSIYCCGGSPFQMTGFEISFDLPAGAVFYYPEGRNWPTSLTIAGITYQARPWKQQLTLDANGGSVSPASMTPGVGSVYGALPVPTRSGFAFDGWYTEPEGGTQITSASAVSYALSRTLYAHYRDADNTPAVSAFSYAFENSYSGFGYSKPYYIPYAQYRLIFGNTVKAKAFHKLQYAQGGGWGGNCYGMSTTSGMFFQDANGIALSAFQPGALTPGSLALSDRNGAWNLTLREFIEAMQVSQYADKIQEDYARNTDLEGLCAAVNAFSSTGGNPVVIAVMRQTGSSKSGHALIGYRIERVSDATSRLYVYDCNYPGAERFITLSTNASGAFTGWYYHLNDIYDWGSAYKGCSISYVPYADFHQVWDKRGKANAMCTFTVNSDVLIRDMDGNSVASIKDGELFTGRDDIYPVVHFGVMADGGLDTQSTASILLPPDLYTIERLPGAEASLQSAEPFEIEMLHVDQSASVATTAGTVTFAVDDASGINYVGIDEGENGSTYNVTLNSTLAGAYEEVYLTGTVLNKAMMLTQVNGVLNVNGAGSGAKLLVDGNEVNLGAVSGGVVPVLSFVANGGGGTMPLRTADQNGEVVLPLCGFTPPAGSVFRAWQINGKTYQPGEICVLEADAAATALWTPGPGMPYVLQSVSREGNGVRVNIRNQSGSGALLMAIAYNDQGKMLACQTREITIPGGAEETVSFSFKQAAPAEIRIFAVDRLTYRPLSKARTIR